MVLNSRRCMVSSVSSRGSSYSYGSATTTGDEQDGGGSPGSDQRSRSYSGSGSVASSSGASSSGGSGRRKRSGSGKGAAGAEVSAKADRPASAGPVLRRQRRTVEKGTRPSSAPFVAKAARPGSATRSGLAVTLRITTNEQIRAKRRKQVLKHDVQRKKVAVALISFHWRCYWRGRERREKAAATMLQRIARGRQARRVLLEELSAATMQFHARRFLRRMAKIRAELLSVATLRLQRAFLARQRRRCRVLQTLAAECTAAAHARAARMEQEKWLAAQQRQRLAERKHAEAVCAALTEELEEKAARAERGRPQEDLQALKERIAREEAAASLIRRVYLRRVMRRRVRVLVHEQRQMKVTELATDVSNLIDAALTVAGGAGAGAGAKSRRHSRARAHSAPPMDSMGSSRGGVAGGEVPGRLASWRRQVSHSAPATRLDSSGGAASSSPSSLHDPPYSRRRRHGSGPGDDGPHSTAQAQLLAAGQIYGTSTRLEQQQQQQQQQQLEEDEGEDSGSWDASLLHTRSGSASRRARVDLIRGRHDNVRGRRGVDAAGRCVRAEVRMAARSLTAQAMPEKQREMQRGYLSQGSDGTPEHWLPRVGEPRPAAAAAAAAVSKKAIRRLSSAAAGNGRHGMSSASRARRRSGSAGGHRQRASARPHSAAY